MAVSRGTSKMLKKDWLMDKYNLQDLSKIDIDAEANCFERVEFIFRENKEV